MFSEFEINRAYKWQKYMDEKNQGKKTHDLSRTKNVTGFLGHLAVEKQFVDLGVWVESTREVKFAGGDTYDLKYENDFLDVKTHKRDFDDKWFFNEKMLVFDTHEHKQETHFVFVRVTPDFERAYIFGVMAYDDFINTSQPGVMPPRGRVTTPTNYHWVYSRDLRPITKYIMRI